MKKILLLCIVFLSIIHSGFSQTYRNEWIDFSKTYYKFTVSTDGVYRINGTDLPTGIAGNNVSDFKLWRNGVEITIFTSVSSGTLGSTGYIEFWGQKNDGKADTELYRDSSYQTNDMISLETNNSTYFLTVNPGGANARFSSPINDLSIPSIPKPYFIDTLTQGYSDQLWGGDAQYISGEYVRSSSYDKNEGWTSEIFTNASITLSGLQAYTQNDAPTMRFIHTGGGGFIGVRNLSTYLNDSLIDQQSNSYFNNYLCDVQQIPMSRISNDAVTVHLLTSDASQYGGVMLAKYKLIYPRKFDFNNQQSFAFDLPADVTGTYLEISDFNSGGINPILIDLANGRRYNCTVDGSGLVKVKLQPSTIIQKCILYSGAPSFVYYINNFTSRNFTDYKQSTNQGDFVLIANNNLNTGGSNNQVEAYRSYKSSTIGGGFNSKIYDVDELTDQFGYGIRKHPIAIRNFLQFARNNFAITPKFALLVGHGVSYSDFYYNQNDANADVLNMIPTWGYPASDILLSAVSKTNPIPATPIGRLSVVNSTELKNYLQKLKEFDISNANNTNTQDQKNWKKQVGLLIGASDDVGVIITNSMLNYKNIIQDTLVGANVQTFNEYNNPNLYQTTVNLTNEINNGVALLAYFGHSSTSGLAFNLSNPNNYTNTNGKYPLFSISGCNAGNFFTYDVNRIVNSIYTISEQFMLAPERGSIGVLASTHFGVLNTLDYYNTQFFNAVGITRYGKSFGEIFQKTNDSTWKLYNGDFLTRLTLEENTLNGDPSIKLFSSPKPDYSVENQNIAISPSFVSMAEDSFLVAVSIHNIGKVTTDSINIQIQRQYPNGNSKTIGTYKLKAVKYADSIFLKVPIIGNVEKGVNYLTVTLDPTNLIDEVSKTNNTATVAFTISADELKPVYPYPFSIVNKTAFKLVATTVDPFQSSRTYQVQMDTTELFNSPLMASSQITQVGGEIEFIPPISTLNDGTVYYWRVAPMVSGSFINYQTASFLYNPNGSFGWNQSNLYQHFKSNLSNLSLDSTTRNFGFANVATSLQANNSVYGFGGFTQNDFSTFVNGVTVSSNDCRSPSILFLVFDNIHFKPWVNDLTGLYGSLSNCSQGIKANIFEFFYWAGATQRKTIMDFMNIIPDGYYVMAKLIPYPYPNNVYDSSYTASWRKDTLINGSGQSLPDYFTKQGFTDIDQETYPRFWTFIYKKNDSTHFKPTSLFSNSMYDVTSLSVNCPVPASSGSITSPVFGPAKQWQQIHWSGHTLETAAPYSDSAIVQVIGITASGTENVLYNLNRAQLDYDISGINAAAYPNVKLKLLTSDTVYATPWQLDQWRLDYTPVPEGALAPNLYYTSNDVVTNATVPFSYKFGVAFKNISDMPFDSLKLQLKLIDANGVEKLIALPKTKPLVTGDTANIYFEIPADNLHGVYNMYLGANTDTSQPEQFLYNNFLYKQFTVNNVLPVNFIGFQAVPSATEVSLLWQVTNETGSNYYSIEHSVDGIQFVAIGKVFVKNNNALMNAYDLLDKNPVIGKNYYRIKIINKDGTAEYSDIRVVTFGKGNAIKVYPNPVKNILQVIIPSDGKPVTLILTNATGQQLLQNSTLGSTQVDMTKFAAGIYYLQAKDATGSTIFRVEKQ